ncbi:MAG: glyoxalase superfamily protein [Rhizobiaceae bacterium]
MSFEPSLPSISSLKGEAGALRQAAERDGKRMTHSQALEQVAKQHGFRDWNTLAARAGNQPPCPVVDYGGRVSGRYLGQTFSGTVIGLNTLGPDHRRVEIQLDEPVDVVSFDSFSNMRSRIRATIDKNGISTMRTSNGEPQLWLDA